MLLEIESGKNDVQANRQLQDLKEFFKGRLLQIKDQRPWVDRKVAKSSPNPTKKGLFEELVRSLTFGKNTTPENDLFFDQERREKEKLETRSLVVNNSKHSQNQKPIKIFDVGDVVDFKGDVVRKIWEIGTIVRCHVDGTYDIKDSTAGIKQNVPQKYIKPTLQDFYTIESLHCIFQEFLSDRDFTWKLLYNRVLQDEFRKTIDK